MRRKCGYCHLSGILADFGMAPGTAFLAPAPEILVDFSRLMCVVGGICATIPLTFPVEDISQTSFQRLLPRPASLFSPHFN